MEQEINRLVESLHSLSPTSTDYSRVLDNLSTLYHLKEMSRIPYTQEYCCTPIKPVAEVEDTEPTPMAEPVEAPVVEEKPKKASTKSKKGESTDSTFTKESVRALLAEASKSGIQIQPIVAKFVPEGKPVKFSEIPASNYPDLVEEIKNAR